MAASGVDEFMACYANKKDTKPALVKSISTKTTSNNPTSSARNPSTFAPQPRPNTTTRNPNKTSSALLSSNSRSHPKSPSSKARSWWALADSQTAGCDQFFGFHKDKPSAGKFFHSPSELEAQRVELEVKTTNGEMGGSTSSELACERVQISQPRPLPLPISTTSTNNQTFLPANSLAQSSPPHSSTEQTSSLSSSSQVSLVQARPWPSSSAQSSFPNSSTTNTNLTLNQSQTSEYQAISPPAPQSKPIESSYLPLLHSLQALTKETLPHIPPSAIPQPNLEEISSHTTSQPLSSLQLSPSPFISLPTPSAIAASCSSAIMNNQANGIHAWNNSRGATSSPMKAQDSNQKMNQNVGPAGTQKQVKATTGTAPASSSAASYILPHMRTKANQPNSPAIPNKDAKANGENTPVTSPVGPRTQIPPHMQAKMKNESPRAGAPGGPSPLPHMGLKANDGVIDAKSSAGSGAHVLPHMKIKAKDETPSEQATSSDVQALNDAKAASRNVSRAPSSSGWGVNRNIKERETNINRQPSPGGWGTQPSLDAEVVQSLILQDMRDLHELPDSSGFPLTEEAITKATGNSPRKPPAKTIGFSDLVSATGVSEGNISEGIVSEDRPREGVRATQGRSAAEELLDWDGSMMPPPLDWDEGRPGFSTLWVPAFLAEWIGNCAKFPSCVVDTSAKEFAASVPIDFDHFKEAEKQPESQPDIKYTSDEEKRLTRTSINDSKKFMETHKKKKVIKQANREDQEARYREIALMALNPEPNPFSPTIDVYLRPATLLDSSGIAEIYNLYIANTCIPEDQVPISNEDAAAMITVAQNEQLPFIVAIRGKPPIAHDKQGRPAPSDKANMPKYEVVIGFASAETFNYCFTSARNGRSRATTNLQLYVHPAFRRKGVGRNLLDRLVHALCPSHTYEEACPWSNPGRCKINETGGSGRWHQMIFQLPVLQNNDPNFETAKNFLYKKFLFRESCRLRSAARTGTHQGHARWMDLVYFQAEASMAENFDPYT